MRVNSSLAVQIVGNISSHPDKAKASECSFLSCTHFSFIPHFRFADGRRPTLPDPMARRYPYRRRNCVAK